MGIWEIVYIIGAILVALFYGFRYPIIWWKKEDWDKCPLSFKIREFIWNFLGSTIGFSIYYFLIKEAIFVVKSQKYEIINFNHVLLLLIAIIGISGFIPLCVDIVSRKIGELINRK